MVCNIIHIVSSLERINFGIWNAAFFGADFLRAKYGVNSIALVCSLPTTPPPDAPVTIHFIGTQPIAESVVSLLNSLQIKIDESIVVSHGCWLEPTRIAHYLKRNGYQWIYVPHGMLEEWSMKQGRLKKFLYWHIVEKRLVKMADRVRAVSKEELKNLHRLFVDKLVLAENGVKAEILKVKPADKIVFLFMARLHFKKGVVPLVKAWRSVMADRLNLRLVIAGPDEGELMNISPYLGGNLQYVGPVYGNEKRHILENSHYYILPSSSEGFPTSVLEAMSFGLIPIVTTGCNFPDIFTHHLGHEIQPNEQSIATILQQLSYVPFDEISSRQNSEFIQANYSEEKIGNDLYVMYRSVRK